METDGIVNNCVVRNGMVVLMIHLLAQSQRGQYILFTNPNLNLDYGLRMHEWPIASICNDKADLNRKYIIK